MVTPGYLARHYAGRKGGRDPALIDIAQDHALKILDDVGAFELGAALKGGTAIRKFRAGNRGRFSTDLDFCAEDPEVARLILETLDGAELSGFQFAVEVVRESRQARLIIQNPSLGAPPVVPAKIDISPRSPWLPTESLAPIQLPVHAVYGFAIPAIPVMCVEETLAEKLARYRRHPLVRDLYDLAWFSTQVFDEPLVRRLLVLKVWQDVVDDRIGEAPFDPSAIVAGRPSEAFAEEDIGLLTQPIDVPGWILQLRSRYAFVTDLDAEEKAIARCSAGDRYRVNEMIERLRPPA